MLGVGDFSQESVRRRAVRWGCIAAGWLAAALVFIGAPAFAQTSTSVVRQAEDAFGVRIGTEQIGLYSENQVRGFSLQNAGNFLIDGHYFVRELAIPDVGLNGVAIEVGTNALRTDFPAPAGIVANHLKTPGDSGNGLVLTTGFRGSLSPFGQFDSWRNFSNGSVTFGGLLDPHSLYPDGTRGGDMSLATVVRYQLGSLRLTGLATWGRTFYNGEYRFLSTATGQQPPKLARGSVPFAPPWLKNGWRDSTLGAIADWPLQDGWGVKGSVFLSGRKMPVNDYALLAVAPSRMATVTVFLPRDQAYQSLSAELGADKRFALGSWNDRVYVAVRRRFSQSRTTGGDTVPLGTIDLTNPIYPAAPTPSGTAPHANTKTQQLTFAVGDDLDIGSLLQLKLGAQRTNYRKNVVTGAAASSTNSDIWLFDGSAIMPVGSWLAYATFVRGLNEMGTAPNNAVNRNEILPVVEATQFEAGLKGKIYNGLSLVASVFQISMPTAGFDATGRYGIVGNVRHSGAEVSLSGEVTAGLSVTAGAVWFDPKISGAAFNSGLIGRKPVGLSSTVGQLGLDYRMPWLPALSFDTQMNFNGPKPATDLDTFSTGSITTIDLGFRFRTNAGDYPITFRGRITNSLNNTQWSTETSGLFARQQGRNYQLSIETRL